MGECPWSTAVPSTRMARCWSRYPVCSKAGGSLRVLKNRLSRASRHAHTLARAPARSSLTVGNPAVCLGRRCSRPHGRLMRSNAPQALTTTRPWFFRCAQFSNFLFPGAKCKTPRTWGQLPPAQSARGGWCGCSAVFSVPLRRIRGRFFLNLLKPNTGAGFKGFPVFPYVSPAMRHICLIAGET